MVQRPFDPEESGKRNQRRIDTQIPRRKKGKAIPPLESEWDLKADTPPSTTLRTPTSQMRRQA